MTYRVTLEMVVDSAEQPARIAERVSAFAFRGTLRDGMSDAGLEVRAILGTCVSEFPMSMPAGDEQT